ncbi:hypothetical protein GCM10009655_25220 [Rhodoglobus aureus]|uniref:Uncharacterized protein n=1 Tax=Rhodoglobus aureus TaxID=191497 RepID=A0ABN1VZP9_9MICO
MLLLIGGVPNSSAGATLSGETSYLESLLNDNVGDIELSVVSLGFDRDVAVVSQNIAIDRSRLSLTHRALHAIGARALYARLATFPLGRLVNSIGPLDQGRVFWRHIRREPAALKALKNADVVIAADLAAVKTAWIAAKRGWCTHAEYDTRAYGLGLSFALADAD